MQLKHLEKMKRTIIVFLVLAIILAGCISSSRKSGDIDKLGNETAITPIDAQNTFIYSVAEGNLKFSYTTVFIGMATLSGIECDLFMNSNGKRTCMIRSNDSISVIWEKFQSEEKYYDPPLVYVRPPLEIGREWDDEIYHHEIVKKETIETKAGDYLCYRIVHTTKDSGHGQGNRYSWCWSPEISMPVEIELPAQKMTLVEIR